MPPPVRVSRAAGQAAPSRSSGAPIRLSRALWRRVGRPMVSAMAAGAVGLILVQVIVLVVWGADTGSSTGPTVALQVGADLWLLAHGVTLRLPDGPVRLLPLGLALLPVLAATTAAHRRASGTHAERVSSSRGTLRPRGLRPPRPVRGGGPVPWRSVSRDVVVVAGSQTLFVLAVSLAVSAPAARPDPRSAVLGPLVLSLTGATVGSLAGYGALRSAWWSLPASVRVPVGAAVTAFVVLVATSAFGVALVLAATLPEIAAADRSLGAGVIGGIGLTALQLAVLPNLVVWAMCYALGTGFRTGTGLVRPADVEAGVVPDLPVFAALPPGPLPRPGWLVLALLPMIAGVMLAMSVRRAAHWSSPRRRMSAVTVSAVLCGMFVAGAAALSAGRIGGGPEFGPSGWVSGLVAVVELAAVGLLVCGVAEIRARRADQPFVVSSARTASWKRRSQSSTSWVERASRRQS